MHESGRHAEVNAIVSRYAARDARADAQRYSWLNPDIRLAAFENDHALLQLLAAAGVSDLARLTLLEVGCGGGGNLLRFLRWGFDPAHLVGNELLPASLETARRRLPHEVELIGGDASELQCCNGKHAVEPRQGLYAPLRPCLQHHLRIPGGTKRPAARLQFGTDLGIVVDLAVIADPPSRGGVVHRLVREVGQVDDGQAGMHQGDQMLMAPDQLGAATVGPALLDRIKLFQQRGRLTVARHRPHDLSCDSTHGGASSAHALNAATAACLPASRPAARSNTSATSRTSSRFMYGPIGRLITLFAMSMATGYWPGWWYCI
jgi:SAM-dependent methyltransferase